MRNAQGHYPGQMGDNMENGGNQPYPVQFDVDYPEGGRNRLSALVRILLAIPIGIVLMFVSGYIDIGDAKLSAIINPFTAGGVLWIAVLLMILFREKYPRWGFNWNLEFLRFGARFEAFLFLLRDEYPSTDEEQSVHLDIAYPDVKEQLNRFLPIIKWLLAIPHYIVLAVLGVIALIVTILAWLTILLTGTYPRGMFNYVVGVSRWAYRVGAYAFLLTTDRYPPFSLKA